MSTPNRSDPDANGPNTGATQAGTDTGEPDSADPLAGKVAFDAGASRGIGAAVAEASAQHGTAVAVAARSEQTGRVPGTIHEVADRIRAAGGQALHRTPRCNPAATCRRR